MFLFIFISGIITVLVGYASTETMLDSFSKSKINDEKSEKSLNALTTLPKLEDMLIRDLNANLSQNDENFESTAEELREEIMRRAKNNEKKNIYILILEAFQELRRRRKPIVTAAVKEPAVGNLSRTSLGNENNNNDARAYKARDGTDIDILEQQERSERDNHNYLFYVTIPIILALLFLILFCCWCLRPAGCCCAMFSEEVCLDDGVVVTSVCPGVI